MKSPFKNALFLIFVSLLTGCGTMQEYVKPTQGPVAELKLVNNWGKEMYGEYARRGLKLRDQRELQFMIYKDKCTETAIVSVGSPDFIKVTSVPAGKRLYLLARGYKHTYRSLWTGPAFHGNDAQCSVPLSFEPEADAQYELEFDQNGQKCFANILKWVFEGDNKVLKKDRTTKREKMCKESLLK